MAKLTQLLSLVTNAYKQDEDTFYLKTDKLTKRQVEYLALVTEVLNETVNTPFICIEVFDRQYLKVTLKALNSKSTHLKKQLIQQLNKQLKVLSILDPFKPLFIRLSVLQSMARKDQAMHFSLKEEADTLYLCFTDQHDLSFALNALNDLPPLFYSSCCMITTGALVKEDKPCLMIKITGDESLKAYLIEKIKTNTQ